MGDVTFEHHLLKEAGTSPNNGALPLIVYRGVMDVGGDEPEAAVERHFDANGWGDGFRGDTFPFHHYHSIAHEVVGCARGAARLQFGGPEGPVVDVQAGDAVLIPAGVVHCRLDDKPGYISIGAYPPGQQPDLCVLSDQDASLSDARDDTEGLELKVVGDAEMPAIRASIAAVPAACDRPAGSRKRPGGEPLAGALSAPHSNTLKSRASRFAEPERVVAVIGEIVAGIGMDEHRVAPAVEHEPGHELGEEGRLEGHLEHGHRMRPHGPVAPAPEAHGEARDQVRPDRRGALPRRRFVIDVGVVAGDRRRRQRWVQTRGSTLTPLVLSNSPSSPVSYISRTISQPPTNSPLT